MSAKLQVSIDRAFRLGWYYEKLGQHDRADAWFKLAYSMAELAE